MKFFDIAGRSGRSLRSAKARTILTSLAIAVGAFTLTLTLAAGNGIRDYTDRLVANNFDPAESIVGRDEEIENNGAPNSAPKEYDESVANLTVGGDGSAMQLKQVTDNDIEELRQLPFVEQVRPNYQLSARYLTREGQKRYTVAVQAYNPGQKPELVAGEVPESGDVADGEIILPDAYINLLGFSNARDAVGQSIALNVSRPFAANSIEDLIGQARAGASPDIPNKTIVLKVRAVAKRPATSIAVTGLPVMLSGHDARDLYMYTSENTPNYGKYIYAYVRVKGGADQAVANDAKAQLKAKGYYAQTSQDIQKTITQFVNILQILVGVFGVITVIASIFGIVNTMYISVLERTREIGLMKALGMSGRDVSWLFRIEAAWIGFLGGLIGALSAFILGASLNPWLNKMLDLGGNSILVFDIVQIIALISVLIIVAIVAGWLPSRKAARLDPIEALRTE